ncbi:hypothetical protein BHE74_00053215 [Ensete ventricosum]|nr:hypothetical protein BHE74_00053215 [Ensete ventricosum]
MDDPGPGPGVSSTIAGGGPSKGSGSEGSIGTPRRLLHGHRLALSPEDFKEDRILTKGSGSPLNMPVLTMEPPKAR